MFNLLISKIKHTHPSEKRLGGFPDRKIQGQDLAGARPTSSSSPSQDTAETPCPLTVSLLGARLLGGPGAISILQTFLSTYCVSGTMPRAGDTNSGQNLLVSVSFPVILVFLFYHDLPVHPRVFIEHLP